MFWQAIFFHIGAHVFGAPMGQRVDLHPAGALFGLEEIERGAGAALIAFASGDPAVEPVKSTGQRPGLAQRTAGVGIASV